MKKILIADDEPSIVTSLEFLMTNSGYEVRAATNGDEALVLIESFRPDLILLDVMMPHRSGYEICLRLREHPDWRHIKVVMLSATGRASEFGKGFSAGADACISKPFSNRELVASVAELLASQ